MRFSAGLRPAGAPGGRLPAVAGLGAPNGRSRVSSPNVHALNRYALGAIGELRHNVCCDDPFTERYVQLSPFLTRSGTVGPVLPILPFNSRCQRRMEKTLRSELIVGTNKNHCVAHFDRVPPDR